MHMRVWKGWTLTEDATAYEEYMRGTGLTQYRATDGKRGAYMTRRDVGANTEFCMVTFWDSLDHIRAFAGDDIERAVFYPEDDRFLVERDERVEHFEVVHHAAAERVSR